jgi:hypothetical protein
MTSLRITNVHLVDPENQTVELGNLSIKMARLPPMILRCQALTARENISRQALSTLVPKFANR